MENTPSDTFFSHVIQRINLRFYAAHKPWEAFLFLVVILGILYALQFSTPNLAGTDGYYHIKFADLMSVEGFKPEFPWLPLTILNPTEFYDHHFLFHVFLIPFTSGDLVLGAKWASVIFASLAFISIWWLLNNQKVPFAFLWSFGLLAVSEAFLYRMSMPRVQSLSLAILALGLNFLLIKQYKLLLPLSFSYVWLFDGYPLILVMSGLYIFTVWMVEGKFNILPLVYTGAGVFLGLLINPYFPDNIIFTIRHLIPKLSGATEVRVGNEWYPYTTAQLLSNSPLTLIAFFSGTIAIGLKGRRIDVRTGLAFFLVILFALMLFQSRRFIEYFPPFALIFAAFAWAPFLGRINDQEGKEKSSIDRYRHQAWLPIAVLSLSLILGGWISIAGAEASLGETKSYRTYSHASSWLKENTLQGERVFQTDWDDFPRLFFYNTWNTYLIGLDPTYMQIKDSELFDLWVAISRGENERPSGLITDLFAAEYVFSDLSHDNFTDRAEEDPGFKEVYRDQEAVIYHIVPSD